MSAFGTPYQFRFTPSWIRHSLKPLPVRADFTAILRAVTPPQRAFHAQQTACGQAGPVLSWVGGRDVEDVALVEPGGGGSDLRRATAWRSGRPGLAAVHERMCGCDEP